MIRVYIKRFTSRSLLEIVLLSIFMLIAKEGGSQIARAYDQEETHYIAIVIDDFGNNGQGTEEMLNLGIPITAAVMPFLPFSAAEAELANKKGHQVIVHMPMEPEVGKASWLGPKGITCSLSEQEIESRVEAAIIELKYAEGINNHTGSKAMKDKRVVDSVARIAKKYNLAFLDSKTTEKSVAKSVCRDHIVPYYERDIFLDHQNNTAYVEKQLDKAGEIALKRGYAIVIGHVGPAGGMTTVKGIQNKIKLLQQKGIKFVKLKDIPPCKQ